MLEQGASRYVDIDLSDTMLGLARDRLTRFGDRVELVQGDFVTAPLAGPFEVVLALGYFDYIGDAERHVDRMRELAVDGGSVVASFPRWTWTKGPVRKLRYEVIDNCPIFDYTEDGLRGLFVGAGFSRVDLEPGRSGFVARATT